MGRATASLSEAVGEGIHQQVANWLRDATNDAATDVSSNEEQQEERHDSVSLQWREHRPPEGGQQGLSLIHI